MFFIASKGSNLYILFATTAADVVPCGGSKTFRETESPRTTSRLYFYLDPLRSVKILRVFKTLIFRNVILSNV